MDNSENASIEMWGIVLGANDQLAAVDLPYGYELVRRKLEDTCLRGDITLQNNKLDMKYYASNLGSSGEPEFIFIHKKEMFYIGAEYFAIEKMLKGNEEAFALFDEIKSRWNKEIFTILSMFRLAQDGNIEIADKKFICSAQYGCNRISNSSMSSLDNPISVYDDLYNWDNSNKSVIDLIKGLPQNLLDELQDVFSRFESGYSASRIEDAYKNLVSLAEIILIGYNSSDKNGKKEKFANRIVVVIADETQARDMQQELRQMYKERSDETHEGNSENINSEQLKKLRQYIRAVVIDFIKFCNDNYLDVEDKSFVGMKKKYVPHLISKVDDFKQHNVLDIQ